MIAIILAIVLACAPPAGVVTTRDLQWRVTYEIETTTHIYRRWSVFEDTGQTVRTIANSKNVDNMERRGYTLVAIERIEAIREVPQVPTEQHHAIQDAMKAAEINPSIP